MRPVGGGSGQGPSSESFQDIAKIAKQIAVRQFQELQFDIFSDPKALSTTRRELSVYVLPERQEDGRVQIKVFVRFRNPQLQQELTRAQLLYGIRRAITDKLLRSGYRDIGRVIIFPSPDESVLAKQTAQSQGRPGGEAALAPGPQSLQKTFAALEKLVPGLVALTERVSETPEEALRQADRFRSPIEAFFRRFRPFFRNAGVEQRVLRSIAMERLLQAEHALGQGLPSSQIENILNAMMDNCATRDKVRAAVLDLLLDFLTSEPRITTPDAVDLGAFVTEHLQRSRTTFEMKTELLQRAAPPSEHRLDPNDPVLQRVLLRSLLRGRRAAERGEGRASLLEEGPPSAGVAGSPVSPQAPSRLARIGWLEALGWAVKAWVVLSPFALWWVLWSRWLTLGESDLLWDATWQWAAEHPWFSVMVMAGLHYGIIRAWAEYNIWRELQNPSAAMRGITAEFFLQHRPEEAKKRFGPDYENVLRAYILVAQPASHPELRALGSAAVPALQAALRDESYQTRASAFHTLQAMKGVSLDASIVPLLKDRDPLTRQAALLLVKEHGVKTPEVLEALIQAIQAPRPGIRVAAIDAVGSWGREVQRAIPVVVVKLHDHDPTVRQAAARTLAHLLDERTVTGDPLQRLLEMMRLDPVEEVRLQALDTLVQLFELPGIEARIGTPLFSRILAEVFATAVGNVNRLTAIHHTSSWQSRNTDVWIRLSDQAINRLGSLAESSLLEALRHGSLVTQAYAAARLGRLGQQASPIVVDALIKALDHRDPRVRVEATQALGHLGPLATVVEALTTALSHQDSNVRVKAVQALAHIGPTATVVEALMRALDDPNPRVRAEAAQALGHIGPAATVAIPALLAHLIHPDDTDLTAFVEALEALEVPQEELFHTLLQDMTSHSRWFWFNRDLPKRLTAHPSLASRANFRMFWQAVVQDPLRQMHLLEVTRMVRVFVSANPTLFQEIPQDETLFRMEAMDELLDLGALISESTRSFPGLSLLPGDLKGIRLWAALRLLEAFDQETLAGLLGEELSGEEEMEEAEGEGRIPIPRIEEFLAEAGSRKLIQERLLTHVIEPLLREVQVAQQQRWPSLGGKITFHPEEVPDERWQTIERVAQILKGAATSSDFIPVPTVRLPAFSHYLTRTYYLFALYEILREVLPLIFEDRFAVAGRLPDEVKYISIAEIITSPRHFDWSRAAPTTHIGMMVPVVYDGGVQPSRTDFLDGLFTMRMGARSREERLRAMAQEAKERQLLARALHAKDDAQKGIEAPPFLVAIWDRFQAKMDEILGVYHRQAGLQSPVEPLWIQQGGGTYGFQLGEWKKIRPRLQHLEEIRWRDSQLGRWTQKLLNQTVRWIEVCLGGDVDPEISQALAPWDPVARETLASAL